MGFCCIGRRRRRAKEDEAAAAATRAWCQEAVNPKVPQTPAASRALETQTPLHTRAVVRPSPLEAELHHHSAAARRVVGLDAARRRHISYVTQGFGRVGDVTPLAPPAAVAPTAVEAV